MCNGRSMNEISRNTIANLFKDLKDQKVDLPRLRFNKHARRGEAAEYSMNSELRSVLAGSNGDKNNLHSDINKAKNDLNNELVDSWKKFRADKAAIDLDIGKYIRRSATIDSSKNLNILSFLDESNAGKKKLHDDINAAKNDLHNELADFWRKFLTDKAAIDSDVSKHVRRGEAADSSMNPELRSVLAGSNADKNNLHNDINKAKSDLNNELVDSWNKFRADKAAIDLDIGKYIRRSATIDSSKNLNILSFLDESNAGKKKLHDDINAAKNDIIKELADTWRKFITDKAAIDSDVSKHVRRGEATDSSMNPETRGLLRNLIIQNSLDKLIGALDTDND
ncbi:unnamed protein product [Adineta steineri]|uniref:Uncharacterized protein n=1 Tax=Adineta steineri TaxID=433720 RepID=A0A814PBH5_9BILA|nr:unnamed protein product [Adineta steineri]CAF3926514.1 unnamed protein product [Adineta steineri]